MARRISTTSEKEKPKAIVFAGPGASDIENTRGLLNDFIGWTDNEIPEDDDTTLIFPIDKVSAKHKGLRTVMEWVNENEAVNEVILDEGEESPSFELFTEFAETREAKNPAFEAITYLVARKESHEPFLVVLWGDEGDQATEAIIDMAIANDIMTLDLTAGMNSISFEEDDEPAKEAKQDDPPWEDPETVTVEMKYEEKALKASDEPLTDSGDMQAEVVKSFSKEALEILNKAEVKDEKSNLAPVPMEMAVPLDIGKWATVGDPIVNRAIEAPVGVATARGLLVDAIEILASLVPSWQTNHAATQAKFRAHEALMWLDHISDDVIVSQAGWQQAPLEVQVALDGFFADSPGIVPKEEEAKVKVIDPNAPEEEEKPKRGRPRANPKTRVEYYDEGDHQWVTWTGRGRRPKDVKFRTVDNVTGEEVQ